MDEGNIYELQPDSSYSMFEVKFDYESDLKMVYLGQVNKTRFLKSSSLKDTKILSDKFTSIPLG